MAMSIEPFSGNTFANVTDPQIALNTFQERPALYYGVNSKFRLDKIQIRVMLEW